MLRVASISLSVLLSLSAAACDGDGDGDLPTSVSLSFSDLPDLGADFVYEGWVLVDGAPVSTGRFQSNGAATQTLDQNITLSAAPTAFILTVEPAVGDVPAPADTHVLAGDITANAANLTIGHAAALGDDLTAAAGTFILATPSSAETDDDNQGIWFLSPSAGTAAPSLTLPTLPAGWVYEGWVVDSSGPVSTGFFTDVSAADSDGPGPTAGVVTPPPFPGQDFINPAVDLTAGFTAVISIEPDPDNSPAPFQLKPLIQPIDAGLVGGMNPQTLTNVIAENTITGSATLQ